MSLRLVCFAVTSMVAVGTVGRWQGDDKETGSDLVIHAGFETFTEPFFERIGEKKRFDPKHGFVVLEDIEAFFLLKRENQKSTPNWPPKRVPAVFGEAIRVTYKADPPTDCSVLVSASSLDGKTLSLSIESPEGSTFTLKEKVEIRLDATNVVYLPSRTSVDKGKHHLYFVVSAHLNKDEQE